MASLLSNLIKQLAALMVALNLHAAPAKPAPKLGAAMPPASSTTYELLTPYPGEASGTLLYLDDSDPDNLVYRSESDPHFWIDASYVEGDQTDFAPTQ